MLNPLRVLTTKEGSAVRSAVAKGLAGVNSVIENPLVTTAVTVGTLAGALALESCGPAPVAPVAPKEAPTQVPPTPTAVETIVMGTPQAEPTPSVLPPTVAPTPTEVIPPTPTPEPSPTPEVTPTKEPTPTSTAAETAEALKQQKLKINGTQPFSLEPFSGKVSDIYTGDNAFVQLTGRFTDQKIEIQLFVDGKLVDTNGNGTGDTTFWIAPEVLTGSKTPLNAESLANLIPGGFQKIEPEAVAEKSAEKPAGQEQKGDKIAELLQGARDDYGAWLRMDNPWGGGQWQEPVLTMQMVDYEVRADGKIVFYLCGKGHGQTIWPKDQVPNVFPKYAKVISVVLDKDQIEVYKPQFKTREEGGKTYYEMISVDRVDGWTPDIFKTQEWVNKPRMGVAINQETAAQLTGFLQDPDHSHYQINGDMTVKSSSGKSKIELW